MVLPSNPKHRALAAIAVVLAVLGALAAASWLLQGPLLRAALARAAAASEGRLEIADVQGTPFDGVRIGLLRWRMAPGDPPAAASTSITLRALTVSWQPLALLAGEVDLGSVVVGSAVLALAGDDAPVAPPDTLALPVRVRVGAARVETLRIERPGAEALVLGPVELAARYAPGVYRIDHLAVAGPWGEAQLSGSLADRPPFAVDARASGQVRPRGAASPGAPSLALAGRAGGALADLQASVRVSPRGVAADRAGGAATLRGRVRAFAPVVLDAFEAEFEAIDLAAWGLGVELRTAIDGTAGFALAPGGDRGGGLAFTGTVRAVNSAAGRLDAGALPVTSIDARMRWRDGRLEFDGVRAALPGGASVEGRVAFEPARALELPWGRMPWPRIALGIRALDPAALWSGAPRAALGGTVNVDGPGIEADLVDAARGGAGARARGAIDAQRLVLEQAVLRLPATGAAASGVAASGPAASGVAASGPAASLSAAGSVGLRPPHALALEGGFERFDPSAVPALRALLAGEAPPPAPALARLRGAVSGRWLLQGPAGALRPRAPGPPLRVRVEVDEGAVAGARVRGTLSAALGDARVSELRLALEFGMLRLSADGALGAAADRLGFALRAPALAALAQPLGLRALSGSVTVDGALRGSLVAPALALTGSATALRIDERYAARTVSLALELPQLSAQVDDARVDLRLEARGLEIGATPLRSLAVRAEGTSRAHTLRAELDGERLGGRVAAAGGLADGPRWSATLSELVVTGAVPARLAAPAAVEWTPASARLGAATVESPFGSLRIGRLGWRDGRVDLLLDASLARLGRLLAATGAAPAGGVADASLDALSLELHADVVAGSRADASGRVEARLRSVADASSAAHDAGVAGDGLLALTLRDGALAGELALNLPTLAFANRVIGPEWSIDGRLRFAGRVGGTLEHPRLDGALSGEGLALEQRAMGWRMRDGTLAGRFDGERFRLDALKFRSAAKEAGTVELRGEVRVADGAGRFELAADRLALPIGPGQRIVVSGSAQASGTGAAIELKGSLRADEGRIELAGGDAPSLPDDVVILPSRATAAAPPAGDSGVAARPASPAAAARAGAPRARLAITSDLTLDLGERLRVYGSGVDARITGSLRLRGALPQAPRAFGTVRVRDGSYAAYGQRLEIVDGVVVFNGPLDNPVLDIVALRRNQRVEAGVALTGTVLSPRVRLVSRPEVPDSEKLSWLVLGVPLDSAQSSGQGAALQAAAATLFGRNDGALAGGLARALGFDVLTIRQSSAGADGLLQSGFGGGPGAALPAVPGQVGAGRTMPGAGTVSDNVVAVGKRLGSKLYVSYEQGLRGVWNLLRIQYELSQRLALRAQTGSESAIDLLYGFSFD